MFPLVIDEARLTAIFHCRVQLAEATDAVYLGVLPDDRSAEAIASSMDRWGKQFGRNLR